MPDPYTPSELQTGAAALRKVRHVIASDGYPSIVLGTDEQDAATVLAAVLPDHDARVRADERAEVAEEIAQAIQASDGDGTRTGWRTLHAAIARQYATPPTTEEPTCD